MAEPGSVSDEPEPGRGNQCIFIRAAPGRGGARLCQSPIDDQRFAVLAEHDIARLEVTVDHPATVGVFDRVANCDEPSQQLPQLDSPFALRSRPVRNETAAMASLRVWPRMKRIA